MPLVMKKDLVNQWGVAVLFIVLCVGGCARTDRDLIRREALTYSVTDVFVDSPGLSLARAAARGDCSEIAKEIASGVDVNIVGGYGITPLWWSAWAGNIEGFECLLKHGADPNYRRIEGLSLMTLLCRMDDPRFLAVALGYGANPNFVDAEPNEPVIFQAIMFSHSGRHVALLLDAGAGINVRDKGGDTPVMRAVTARGDYRLVWALLQRGANWKIKAKDGRSLVDIIPIRGINPDGDQVAWREKVMAFIDEDHTGDCADH